MDEQAEKTKITDRLKAGFGKVKDRVKALPRKVLIAAAAILAVLIVVAVVAVALLNHRDYAVLVTGVSDNEVSKVITWLDGQGIANYRMESNGTILVPEGQEDNLKARLLMADVTESGYFYSTYFDHINSLSTEAERNQVTLMDLQDRLGATIRNMQGIRDAVVFINPGEDRSYILDNNIVVEATASVEVTMVDGESLSGEMAEAIRYLVSHAMKGLEIESVVILDNLGNVYDMFSADDSAASELKLRLETEFANRIRTQVMEVLVPFFGEDNVRVGVNCEVEVGNVSEHRTDYWLPEYAQDGSTDGRGIRGSEAYSYGVGRPGDGGVGGLVGAEVNSDISEQVEDLADPNGDETAIAGDAQIDYRTSNSEKDITNDAGRLTDCTVSVSINSAVAEGLNLGEIQQHVARAARISGEIDEVTGEENLDGKISVMAMEFYNPTVTPPNPIIDGGEILGVKLWVWIAVGVGLLLFVILLLIILLLRRKRRKKQEAEEQARLEQEQREVDALLATAGFGEPGAETGADVMDLQSEKSMELRKDIRQFVSDNPEVAAQMVRSWLRGDNDNG